MAKTLQDYTASESVAPYIQVVASTTNTMDVCRAVVNNAASGNKTLTVAGSDVTLYMVQGTIYPIACEKSSAATIMHLY